MSVLSDIKNLLKKYLKNPVIIIAGSYLLWRFIQKNKKKNKSEWLTERLDIIHDDIFYDNSLKKYVLVKNDRVFSSDKKEDLIKLIR